MKTHQDVARLVEALGNLVGWVYSGETTGHFQFVHKEDAAVIGHLWQDIQRSFLVRPCQHCAQTANYGIDTMIEMGISRIRIVLDDRLLPLLTLERATLAALTPKIAKTTQVVTAEAGL